MMLAVLYRFDILKGGLNFLRVVAPFGLESSGSEFSAAHHLVVVLQLDQVSVDLLVLFQFEAVLVYLVRQVLYLVGQALYLLLVEVQVDDVLYDVFALFVDNGFRFLAHLV